MKCIGKKFLLAALATAFLYLPSQALAADVEINRGETAAEDWKNDAGEVVVKGGGDEDSTANVKDNYVTINSGSYTGIFGGMTSTGDAGNNIVNFYGDKVSGGIVGGFTFYNENLTAGNVFNNTINFYGGSANWISGGEVGYVGSSSDFSQFTGGNVFNNTVNIYGGTVGSSTDGGIIGGSALTGSAYNNYINISGGTVKGDVIAGEVQQPQSTSEVRDNTITITGSPDLSGATFYGGLYGSGYAANGNVLQINTSGITIGSINTDSFSKVEFGIPQAFTAGGTILTLNNFSDLSSNMNKIGVTLRGDSPLQTGDTFNLVVNGMSVSSDLVSSADTASVQVSAAKGALLSGTVNLLSSDDGITATVGNFDINEQAYEETAKTSEGEFAKVIIPELDPFTQSMTDSMLDDSEEGSTEAEFHTADIGAVNGYHIFLNSGGGRIKAKTGGGTYIRTSRSNYDLGFARTFEGTAAGRLYIAPVFERAQGHYTAQLPKNSLGQWMRGHGSTKYTAGGFIARLLNHSGFYYEASIRGGKAENSFGSSDFIIDDIKTHVTYDMSAPVWTGHLRFGKAQKLNPKTLLDSYLMYCYTRQSGMSTTMSEGTRVHFDSVSGHSLRLGYRMTTRINKISKVYGGLAWQYDKNSDSSVTAFSQSKKSEGAKGHSGMIELGWQIKPNKNTSWIVDINATGWMGRMQGFNVMAKIQKSF